MAVTTAFLLAANVARATLIDTTIDSFDQVGSPSPWVALLTTDINYDATNPAKDSLAGMNLMYQLDGAGSGVPVTGHFTETGLDVFGGTRDAYLTAIKQVAPPFNPNTPGFTATVDIAPPVTPNEFSYEGGLYVHGKVVLAYTGILPSGTDGPGSQFDINFADFDYNGENLHVTAMIDDTVHTPFSVTKDLAMDVSPSSTPSYDLLLPLSGLSSSGLDLSDPVHLSFTFDFDAGVFNKDWTIADISLQTPSEGPPPHPTPEPSSLILACIGLGGILVLRWRHRTRKGRGAPVVAPTGNSLGLPCRFGV